MPSYNCTDEFGNAINATRRLHKFTGRGAYARSRGAGLLPDVGDAIGFERFEEIDMSLNPNFVKQWKDLKRYAANYRDAVTNQRKPFNEKETGALLEPLIATLKPSGNFEGYVDEPQTWDGRSAGTGFPLEVKYKGVSHKDEPSHIAPQAFDYTYLDDTGSYQRENFKQGQGAFLVDGFSSRQVTDVRDQKDLRTGVVVIYDQNPRNRTTRFLPPRVVYYDDPVGPNSYVHRKWLQSDIGKHGILINNRSDGVMPGPLSRRYVTSGVSGGGSSGGAKRKRAGNRSNRSSV